ncbi:MAG: competence/damage-inducible protein A, partial [Oscillospiraceae bacterium]
MKNSLVAEILAVGTELLLGNIANTDAQDISIALSELGINVFYHSVVG